MRYIKTENYQIEFIEANDEGKVLNSIGLQLGEVYFQIKNKKVAFYLNDSEKPFDNFIWSMNLPITIDGETYEDEEEASAALSALMVDHFQEQLDELREDLDEEVLRSTEKDAEHDAEISGLTDSLNNEIARAISAETEIANDLDQEIADRIADVDAEEARALAAEEDLDDKIDSLNDKVDDEITRSTAKDAEHDAEISGLTADLNNEITRAMSAETVLHDEILAEEARALAAESALTDALNDEITRSTAKDASHDAEISGLTTSLQNEINRAVGAENSLRDDLNDEVSARTSADSAMVQRITALEVGKADKSDVYTKAESDNKYATKEYVSGNTYTKAEIATMMADKADKLNAVSTALYNSQNKTIDFKNIYGNVIASVDARDFIKDGMVDTVSVSGTNLVITFNTDAGKEDIVVPLPDIFDPSNYYTKAETDEAIADAIDDIDLSNYYTKSEVDASQTAQDNKINAISGKVDTISANTYTKTEVDASQLAQDNKINAISGDVQTLSGEVQTISGSAITSGEVQTMIDEAVSGKQDTLSAGRAIDITNNIISFTLPISAGTGENSVVEGYQTKTYSNYCHAEGRGSTAGKSGSNKGYSSHAEGEVTLAEGNMSHSEGNHTQANGDSSHAEGSYTNAYGSCSHAEGSDTNAYNDYEHASGKFNKSTKLNSTYGNSGNTIFSVGNGAGNTKRHNTVEVRQNGDIYIADTSQITGTGSGETEGHNFYDVPMIKLQDALGQGGGGVTSGQVQTMIDNSLSGYQETLSAGTNVQINNNVISATDTKYTAGDGISISNQNVISTVTKFWCGTQAQYDAISVKDPNTVYMIHS